MSVRQLRCFCLVVAAMLLTGGLARAAEIRTWTDASGKFKVEARLVVEENGIVLLKRKGGKTLKIQRNKLSKKDQDYLDAQSTGDENPFVEVEDPQATLLTSVATLKRKLNAKVTFNPKTGAITLQYDWSSKRQLRDFSSGDVKPTLVRGGLSVPAGCVLKHGVDFSEVTIAVPVFVPSMRGSLIKTSGGAVASMGGLNPNTIYLADKHVQKGMIVPQERRKGMQFVQLVLTPKHLRFEYGDRDAPSQLGMAAAAFHPGSVELCGGDIGFQYGPLVLTGKLDNKWLKEFAAAKK